MYKTEDNNIIEADYLGTPRQRAFLQECRLQGGRADGVRAVQVHAGNGLEFMVLPDRALDIPYLYYKGQALHYASPVGIVHPAYYKKEGFRWLDGFFVGALTSCGITFSGHPEQDGEDALGLHGPLSYIPCDGLKLTEKDYAGDLCLSIEGSMHDVSTLGRHLELKRTISTSTAESAFTIQDTVINHSYTKEPLMLLYHINFGYPLLNPLARMYGDIAYTEPGNEISSTDKELNEALMCCKAREGYEERLFYHHFDYEKGLRNIGILQNQEENALGVVLSYEAQQLPSLLQWKLMRKGAYVMGIEPCTAPPKGRAFLRERCLLPYLEPGEQYSIMIKYQVTNQRTQFFSLL